MENYFEMWRNKRVFKIENDRFKNKKYIYTSPVKICCEGFNNKDLYPMIFSDVYSKHLRMKGYNVLYSLAFNNLNEEAFQYSKSKGTDFLSLYENYIYDIKNIGIGFDVEKEMYFSDKNFIVFAQNIFKKLYDDNLIQLKDLDIVTDFRGQTIYNSFEYNIEDSKILSKEGEELFIKQKKVLTLDTKKYALSIIDRINDMKLDKSLLDEIYQCLDVKKGLKINLFSSLEDVQIEIPFDNPEFLGGVSFVFLNPLYTDVRKYTSLDEMNMLEEYINSIEHKSDFYLGVNLKNPLNNEDIYLFASYKYDEAIHIGIPDINESDLKFAIENEISYNEIYDSGIIINSDFLSNMPCDDAKEAIILNFTMEEMGTVYYKSNLDEIIISSYEDLGVLAPVVNNEFYKYRVLDNNYYPIYFTNRYKISIEQDDLIDEELSKIVLNDLFIKMISPTYERVYDKDVGNGDFFECYSRYNEFDDTLAVLKESDAAISIIMNTYFNLIMKNYNKDYSDFNDIIVLKNLEILDDYKDEYKRLKVSFVDEVLGRFSVDSYRLFLCLEEGYTDDLGDTLVKVKYYQDILSEIKESLSGEFVNSEFINPQFSDFVREQNKLLDAFMIKKYTKNLIELYNSYIKKRSLSLQEAKAYTIMISLICPVTAEEINEDVFKTRYSIFYSEWPL